MGATLLKCSILLDTHMGPLSRLVSMQLDFTSHRQSWAYWYLCWEVWLTLMVWNHLINKITCSKVKLHLMRKNRPEKSDQSLESRVRKCNWGFHFFAFKCCISQLSVDRFRIFFCGTYDLRSCEKFTKCLLIWSTESWETQHLKAKKHKLKFNFRTLLKWGEGA